MGGKMIAPKSKLLVGSNGKWVPADIKVMGYGRNAYFRIVTDKGVIDLYGPKDRLVWGLRAAADLLDGREPSPMVTEHRASRGDVTNDLETERAGSQLLDVTKLTPAEVADYFRQSEILADSHAADVEEALKHQLTSDQANRDLEKVLIQLSPADLIDDSGQPKWGSQTAIAAVLGIPNAGSYRPRIQAVLAKLGRRNSTTTAAKPQNQQKTA